MREALRGRRLVGSRLWGSLIPLQTVLRVGAAGPGLRQVAGQRES